MNFANGKATASMNGKLILLDSTVIVNYLRGDTKTVLYLNNLPIPTISIITEAEIYQGAKNAQELKKWEKLMSNLKIVLITPEISSAAVNLVKQHHLSHGLHILDALIAATAIENKYTLLTSNIKHFQMIKGLNLKPWPLN